MPHSLQTNGSESTEWSEESKAPKERGREKEIFVCECESLSWLSVFVLRLWLLFFSFRAVPFHKCSLFIFSHFFGIVCLHHCHCRLSFVSLSFSREFSQTNGGGGGGGGGDDRGIVSCAFNWNENVHSKTNNMCTIYSWYGSRVLLVQTGSREDGRKKHRIEWLFFVVVVVSTRHLPCRTHWFVHIILKHTHNSRNQRNDSLNLTSVRSRLSLLTIADYYFNGSSDDSIFTLRLPLDYNFYSISSTFLSALLGSTFRSTLWSTRLANTNHVLYCNWVLHFFVIFKMVKDLRAFGILVSLV